jgi:hypothetical protein
VKTFPDSPYDLEEVLTGLGTGEAVVTVLSERGAPTPVAVTRLRAPRSLMGPVEADALDRAVKDSPLYGRYAQAVDRESAYEKLTAARTGGDPASGSPSPSPSSPSAGRHDAPRPKEDASVVEQVVGSGLFKSLARSVGTQIGREITRSIFGTARKRR